MDPFRIVSFSSRGPTDANEIAPHLSAVGFEVYTAAQSANPNGEIYDPSGYSVVGGTSFSSPMTAGAMAVLMGARPGLQARHYRSLLINSASRLPLGEDGSVPVQHTGAGVLNLDAALRATAAAFPTGLSFGAGGATVETAREFSITNVGAAAETFTLTPWPHPGSPAPELSLNSFTLEPGASRAIIARWSHTALSEAEHQGVLVVRGSNSDAELRIPYWYAVTGRAPRYLASFIQPTSAPVNGSATLYLRVTDPSGVVLADVQPEVTVESGDGFVVSSRSLDSLYPGVWRIQLRMGPFSGPNVFLARAGEATRRISIRGRE
jgi:hypothetical protein